MLGRKGLAVQLFEKVRFPREKPCGEGLMPDGVAVLQRLGLLAAVGGCPFYGVRFHFEGRVTQARAPNIIHFRSPGRGQRRRVLDQILLSTAAATPGVQVHTGTPVDGPIVEKGTVVGLKVGGQELRAPLLIGADGANSTIREQLRLNGTAGRDRFGIRAHFRLPDRTVEVPWVELFVGLGHEIYVTPLPERQIAVAILANSDTGGHLHPATNFVNLCSTFPVLAARLDGAEQITPVIGASPLSRGARAGVTRGAVLLGDAAGALDPIAGTGMTQALITAELLADHIAHRRGSDWTWLRSFEHGRRSMLWGHRVLTQVLLWLSQRPRLATRVLIAPGRCSLLLRSLP
jgi:2-polyprenyl-6-methoxyphenol hydroxylase-like FAD-dependent oxidoreductase